MNGTSTISSSDQKPSQVSFYRIVVIPARLRAETLHFGVQARLRFLCVSRLLDSAFRRDSKSGTAVAERESGYPGREPYATRGNRRA